MFAALIPLLGPLVERMVGLIPDPNAREKARAEMMQQLLEVFAKADQAQLEVNKAEAASGSVFVAGWRPFIGWVCGAALAYQYILRPALTGLFDALGIVHAPVLIGLDDNLWQLLLAMLGMGGLRTFEKMKGVAR
jgi:hypothetical protein